MFKLVKFLTLLALIFNSHSALAIDTLQIEKQYSNSIPISISTVLQEEDPDLKKVLQSIVNISGNDLSTTVDVAYQGLQNYQTESEILDLKKYAFKNILYNININVFSKSKEDQSYVAEVKIYDVRNEIILAEKKYSFKLSTLRKVAHIIADISYYAITGKQGYFQSKILFASSDQVKTKVSKKSIYVIDQDGYGEKLLIQGGILSTPVFDKNNNAILYVDMTTGEPNLKGMNIANQAKMSLDKIYPGFEPDRYISTPSVCNQDKCIMVTKLFGSGGDIYKMSNTGESKVVSGDINTSPSLSPDDDMVVFESNADGRRNLYVASTTLSSLGRKLLTGNDGVYAEPKWSPSGEFIVFTKLRNGLFHLGIIKSDGTEEQILYSSYMIENPTWMPNSDAIIFSEKRSSSAKSILKMIDLNGKIVRTIPTSVGATSSSVWLIR